MSTRVRESAMKPRVSPDFNGDRATIDVRQELLANLTSVHLKAVECVVLEKHLLLKESMPQELRGAFPAEPPKSFWEQHYYAVLFEKFGLFGDYDLIGSVKKVSSIGPERRWQSGRCPGWPRHWNGRPFFGRRTCG